MGTKSRIFTILFCLVGVGLYVGGIVTNVLILDTSQKHRDRMCKASSSNCDWGKFFQTVFQLGIAASVLGLVHALAFGGLFIKNRHLPLALWSLVSAVLVFVLWMATIILGWADSGINFIIGYFGIPTYSEGPSNLVKINNVPATQYTLAANWLTSPRRMAAPGAQGQYRFVAKFIEAMAPAMSKEEFFTRDIREFAHAKQGMAVLVLNHMILAYAFGAIFLAIAHLIARRRERASTHHHVTKEGTPRHSSV